MKQSVSWQVVDELSMENNRLKDEIIRVRK